MADYAGTLTLDNDRAERVSRNFGMAIGQYDLTNYNTTGAEITDLTKWFQTIKRVISDGFSDNGYLVRWNTTDKCFHAYYPTIEHDHNFTIIGGTAAAGTDVLNVKAVVLGKEEATNKTVIGSDNATKGGVVENAKSPGTEVADDVDVGVINFAAFGLL